MENLTDKEKAFLAHIEGEIEKVKSGQLKAEDVKKSIMDELKDQYITKAAFDELKTLAENVSLELKSYKEGAKKEVPQSLGQAVKSYLKEHAAEFKGMAEGTFKKFEVKSAGNMLASTNITGTIPAAERVAGINDVARERNFLIDVIGATPTTSTTIEFAEKVNKDGTAVFIADTDSFVQIDFDLEVNSASVRDVGAFITVHENMLDDIDGLSAEVDRELVYEVKKAADAGVLSGSGSSPYLKGIATYATAGFSLTNIEIATPTIWDAISAAMNQVRQTGFDEANMIVMHPADYENALGSKDSQGRYVGHPSLAPDGLRFAGIPITTSTFITAGYILVGNKMKSHIRVKQDMELAIGYNLTGEFAKRLLTVRASMRMAHYIKDNDIYSFVYDQIADIQAAITKV